MKPHSVIVGFTLIELMIVVSLCLLMAQLTISYFSLFDTVIVRSELLSLRMFFQQMRYNAVQTKKELIVTIYPINACYYTNNYRKIFHSAVCFGALEGALGPPSAPKNHITQPITFKENKIHFFPDGTISSGIIYVVDKHKNSGFAITNGVGAVSYMRLYRYDRGSWVLW